MKSKRNKKCSLYNKLYLFSNNEKKNLAFQKFKNSALAEWL